MNAVNESRDKLVRFKEQFDIRMPLYQDEGAVNTGRWGIQAVPTTFFVNRMGDVHAVRVGHVPEDELAKLIKEILKFGD